VHPPAITTTTTIRLFKSQLSANKTKSPLFFLKRILYSILVCGLCKGGEKLFLKKGEPA
jgi:hypothetical protein